ncbi:MAG: 1-acyl-sn-glycerol-3-phosphate acyltransferase [Deltaproteobacteria bacterium]|nr:1-acyl-sn-glycerol-3-phosphate acyltransferase [Deltaproteobacteria bacterium]
MTEPVVPVSESSEERAALSGAAADPYTAMTPRFGRTARAFAGRFFSGFKLEPSDAEELRKLEARGAVVYVMRYSSRLDYFLFNWLFVAQGIRLSSVANGIRFYYYRPLGQALRLLFKGMVERLRLGFNGMRERQIACTRQILREGGSLFLFLRTDKIGQGLRTRRGAVASGHSELDYLREVVDTCFVEPAPVSLVPLTLFWRKGSRRERRFLNVFYGAPSRPTDTGKVISFLWNYRSLVVRVGTPLDLRAFVDERRAGGRERLIKQVRRALMIFLRREEKPVLGAALREVAKIGEAVMAEPEVQRAIDEVAQGQRSRGRVEARARRYLREIAARQSPTALAILDVIVGWMFERLFGRVEVHGVDRIVEAAKLHPLILVPSHRSHFDYLILSWLFYERHLVPPHVAAGNNLAFWPLGPIFRRAGGFFLRRSFEGDPLYTAVFSSYIQLLIKDGATLEFFIEGTRSRTGKTLMPRLGMLNMIVEAFAHGVRRDVYLVPVGFTYERLVEEGSITQERRGAKKTGESFMQLVRARRILRHRFGSVIVRFGEPLSLAERVRVDPALPGQRDSERRVELRRITERLGYELCSCINGLITAGRSAVSAAALLASPTQGLREEEFCGRVVEIGALLQLLGVQLSEPVERALKEGQPEAMLELLLQAQLVERKSTRTGDLLHYAPEVRDRLDYYRATIAPALVWPALLALALRAGGTREAVLARANTWIELLRLEYFPPASDAERRATLELVLRHILARGWAAPASSDELLLVTAEPGWLDLLAAQVEPVCEAYRALFQVVEACSGTEARKQLLEEAASVLKDHLLVGEARFPESSSPVTFQNALSLLLQEDVLCCEGNPLRPDACFGPGPRWEQLGLLRERVAVALASR